MTKLVPLLFAIGVAVYALIDCVRTDESQVKALPRSLWLIFIAFVPLVGPITWLVIGRQRADAPPPPRVQRPKGLVAPEDDPEFMRRLDEQRWRERMRKRREQGGEQSGHADRDIDDQGNPPAQAV